MGGIRCDRDDPMSLPLDELPRVLKHVALARAGVALDSYDPIRAGGDELHGAALSLVEVARPETVPDRLLRRKRADGAAAVSFNPENPLLPAPARSGVVK